MIVKYYFSSDASNKKISIFPFLIKTEKKYLDLSSIQKLLEEDEVDLSTIDSYKYFNEEKGGYVKIKPNESYQVISNLTLLLHLKEEVDNEIIELDEKLTKIEKSKEEIIKPVTFVNKNNIKKDLIYLYASPIVKRIKGNSGTFTDFNESIDYQGEIENICKAINNSERKINFNCVFEPCDFNMFYSSVKESPRILHISSHGELREVDSQQVFYLCLEKEGVLDKINENDIKSKLKNNNIELVFVNACYSEALGKIFYESGVEHVICIHIMTKISDQAAKDFSFHFYRHLMNGETIETSFEKSKKLFLNENQNKLQECCCNHSHKRDCSFKEKNKREKDEIHKKFHVKQCSCSYTEYHTHNIACKYIKGYEKYMKSIKLNNDQIVKLCCCSPEIPHNESNKFILYSRNHSKILFPNSPMPVPGDGYGTLNIINKNFFKNCNLYATENNVPGDKFVGRNSNVKNVLDILKKNNIHFINIFGEKSIGKKTFAKFTGMYLFERNIIDDVFFIEIKIGDALSNIEAIKKKIKDIQVQSSHQQKILIIISFPTIAEDFLFKIINDMFNELSKSVNIYFYMFIIDTSYTKEQVAQVTPKNKSFKNFQLLPLSNESAENLLKLFITEQLTCEQISYIIEQAHGSSGAVCNYASFLGTSKHFFDFESKIKQIKKDAEKFTNLLKSEVNKSKYFFSLAVFPKGLAAPMFNMIDEEFSKILKEENEFVLKCEDIKIGNFWIKLKDAFCQEVIKNTKEDIKRVCIEKIVIMLAKFFVKFIQYFQSKKSSEDIENNFHEREFSALNGEGIWRTFNKQIFEKIFKDKSEVDFNTIHYLKKYADNINYIISCNQKIFMSFINDKNEVFIECLEQIFLCFPTILKIKNKFSIFKNVVLRFMQYCREFSLTKSLERLMLFSDGISINTKIDTGLEKFLPNDLFKYSDCPEIQSEAFYLKALLSIVAKESNNKNVDNDKIVYNFKEAYNKTHEMKYMIYLSIFYYCIKSYQKAKKNFESCIKNENHVKITPGILLVQTYFYLAKTCEIISSPEEAYEYAKECCNIAKYKNLNIKENNIKKIEEYMNLLKMKINYNITIISSNSLVSFNNLPVPSIRNNNSYFISQTLSKKVKKKIRIKNLVLSIENLQEVFRSKGDILIITSDDYLDNNLILETPFGESEQLPLNEFKKILEPGFAQNYKLIVLGFANSYLFYDAFSQCDNVIFFEKFELVQFQESFISNTESSKSYDSMKKPPEKVKNLKNSKKNKIAFLKGDPKSYDDLYQLNDSQNFDSVKIVLNQLIIDFIIHLIENISNENSLSDSFQLSKKTFLNSFNKKGLAKAFSKDLTNYITLKEKKQDELYFFDDIPYGKIVLNPPLFSWLNECQNTSFQKKDEIYELIKMIKKDKIKIINLCGCSGSGKTIVGTEIAIFFNRHMDFKDGIFFNTKYSKRENYQMKEITESVLIKNGIKGKEIKGKEIKEKEIKDIFIIFDIFDQPYKKAKQKNSFFDNIDKSLNYLIISRDPISNPKIKEYRLSNHKDNCTENSNKSIQSAKSGRKKKKGKKEKNTGISRKYSNESIHSLKSMTRSFQSNGNSLGLNLNFSSNINQIEAFAKNFGNKESVREFSPQNDYDDMIDDFRNSFSSGSFEDSVDIDEAIINKVKNNSINNFK